MHPVRLGPARMLYQFDGALQQFGQAEAENDADDRLDVFESIHAADLWALTEYTKFCKNPLVGRLISIPGG